MGTGHQSHPGKGSTSQLPRGDLAAGCSLLVGGGSAQPPRGSEPPECPQAFQRDHICLLPAPASSLPAVRCCQGASNPPAPGGGGTASGSLRPRDVPSLAER